MALLRLFCNCAKTRLQSCTTLSVSPHTSSISIALRKAQNTTARVQVLRRQWMSYSRKKALPFEVNTTNLGKDILVYSFKNDRFYKLLSYFGCAQFAFWAYLALFSFQTLRDGPEESEVTTESSWWRRMASHESKYKNGISILCFAFGYLVLCISLMYPSRAVRKLWLLKEGNSVRLETFSVLPKQRTLVMPVNGVSCLQTRADSAAQIPMKVKGKWFFFLLDKRGKFHNTELFDFAVGLNRGLR